MKHLEDSLQIAVADYLRLQYTDLLSWHTPNGGKRNKREAARLKRMGVRPGVADVMLYWLDSDLCMNAGAIELKCGKNKLQPSQVTFRNDWMNTGGHYAICRSVDEVMHWLSAWGVPKGRKP